MKKVSIIINEKKDITVDIYYDDVSKQILQVNFAGTVLSSDEIKDLGIATIDEKLIEASKTINIKG